MKPDATAPPMLTLAVEPAGSDDGLACIAAYFAELDRRFDGGFDAGGSVHAHAAGLDAHGCFIVARREGRPVGCIALVPEGAGLGEIKRLWVAPDARGLGVAGTLVRFAERTALELGLVRLRLDTNRALTEAQDLYRRLGYREIGRYNDNPYAHHWFEKVLDGSGSAGSF